MRFLSLAAIGLLASSGAALACPDWNQQGTSYTYTGDQLYSPQSFGVVAGGPNSLSSCGTVSRTGYVTSAPDFSFWLSGMDQYRLVLDVDAQCDTVMLVNAVDTSWHFDDDSNGNFDPRIELTGANLLNGRVDVWVGTYSSGEYCDAQLTLETWFANTTQPAPTPTPPPPPPPAPVAEACPDYGFTGASYSFTGNDLYSRRSFPTTAGGGADLSNCGAINRFGYASTAPQFSFYLSGMDQYYLMADVIADCDSVMVMNTANGTWLFDDDSNPNGSLDPQIRVEGANSLNGRVDVWVGTYSGGACNATLNLETFYLAGGGGGGQPGGNCPSYAYTGQSYNLTGQQLYSPQRYNVQAGGTANLRNCPNIVNRSGTVSVAPNYSFYLSGMEQYGRLEVEVTQASCDTVLLVNTPDTRWHFDDDSRGNLQPLLNLYGAGALNGRLDVWVGTYNGSSCPATLELETWYN